MPSCRAPTQRIQKPASRAGVFLTATLLGATSVLAGCADDALPSESEVDALAQQVDDSWWIDSGPGKEISGNAFRAGFEKQPQNVYYICRVNTSLGVVPGKLYAGNCHTGYNGKEINHHSKFQVLMNYTSTLRWQNVTDTWPKNAVSAGRENGHSVFLCQASFEGSQIPGKLINNVCYTTYGGKETAHRGKSFRQLVKD